MTPYKTLIPVLEYTRQYFMSEYEKRPFERTLFRRVFVLMTSKKLLKAKLFSIETASDGVKKYVGTVRVFLVFFFKHEVYVVASYQPGRAARHRHIVQMLYSYRM